MADGTCSRDYHTIIRPCQVSITQKTVSIESHNDQERPHNLGAARVAFDDKGTAIKDNDDQAQGRSIEMDAARAALETREGF